VRIFFTSDDIVILSMAMNKSSSSKAGAAVSVAVNVKSNLDATIPLRVTSELKQSLLLLSAQDDRSLSNYITRLLEAHVAGVTTATFTMKGAAKAKAAKK
jgi:predicted DNA-binding protein